MKVALNTIVITSILLICNEIFCIVFSNIFCISSDYSTNFISSFSILTYSCTINVLHVFWIVKIKKEKVICYICGFWKSLWWTDGLWCKLLLNNINGKMYKVIYNMHQNIKSRIVYNNAVSDFFCVFPLSFFLCI